MGFYGFPKWRQWEEAQIALPEFLAIRPFQTRIIDCRCVDQFEIQIAWLFTYLKSVIASTRMCTSVATLRIDLPTDYAFSTRLFKVEVFQPLEWLKHLLQRGPAYFPRRWALPSLRHSLPWPLTVKYLSILIGNVLLIVQLLAFQQTVLFGGPFTIRQPMSHVTPWLHIHREVLLSCLTASMISTSVKWSEVRCV